ncbi:MAG TPA: hypothetical protein VHO25_03455, partial [Polyangiaceae bacterium]|nr:hypothetical protein [Polyangiaceae bacterium]
MWAGADQTIAKYLARGAEPQARTALAISGRYPSALVVPVRDESATFMCGLSAALASRPGALVIVVVNANADSDAAVRRSNERLLTALRGYDGAAATSVGAGTELVPFESATLLLVDCSSSGRELPTKQGVGLARKIGCDLALGLWRDGVVNSPWLFSSDADVTLPPNYFDADALAHATAGALLFDFEHQPSGDAELDRATLEYELYLRYYTLGLAWAGSPYAFHTLGSCLAVRAEAYAAVRGFPKREAGEDFHLLSKVAKVAVVQTLHRQKIGIASRRSLRAPFGTGARVATLLAGEALEFHDPRLFDLLKAVLDAQRRWVQAPTAGFELSVKDEGVRDLWGECLAVLDELGLDQALSHAAQIGGDSADRLLHLHTWFDALKTLRLLRAVQQ